LVREVLVPVVANRAALLLAAVAAAAWLPVKFDSAGVWRGGPASLLPGVLTRWDGRWYFSIAHDGYAYVPGQESNVVFTPLLPALMHLGGAITGNLGPDGLLGVALIVSNAALAVSLFLLWHLTEQAWGRPIANRTVLCLVAFPTSFFLSAAYPESLFLALALAAFAAGERGRWWLVGILGALAALARIYGVLIVIPLAWMYLTRHGRRIDAQWVWLGLIPAALVSWLGYLYVLTGDPLVVIHAEAAWGRAATLPWQAIMLFWASPQTPGSIVHFFIDTACALGFGVLVALTWRRLRRSHLALYATLFYLPIIASGLFASAPRYALELFPAFVVLAQLTYRRPVFGAYLAISSAASVIAIVSFAIGNFVA
jgi:hypothetical protein